MERQIYSIYINRINPENYVTFVHAYSVEDAIGQVTGSEGELYGVRVPVVAVLTSTLYNR